jgi:alkanesulfonate monooxygenase SsuD/methylene tetrahydromethanopterin reductase-like flavin-dependent oxidoreductase (luciferase family)
VRVLQALWAEPHVTFEGQWHHINDAGINPLPLSRRIPIWFGGHHDLTLRRVAKWGDGWMMNAHPAGAAEADFAKLRAYAKQEGRDPASIGVEVWVPPAPATRRVGAKSSASGSVRASLTSRSIAPSSAATTSASRIFTAESGLSDPADRSGCR